MTRVSSFLRPSTLAFLAAGSLPFWTACSGRSIEPASEGGPDATSSPAPTPSQSVVPSGGASSSSSSARTDPDSGPPDAASPPAGLVPGLVGVGYGGLRITSRDGGKTWPVRTAAKNGGGDDDELLRAVAYANGLWLAVGWSATTSKDGVRWTPLARINQAGGATFTGAPSCGLVEGLASDGAAFYVVCAEYGQPDAVFRSTDGKSFTRLGTIGQLGGHPALAHRNGTFYAYGDAGTSYRSTDAVTWVRDTSLDRATFCEGRWQSRAACRDASWFAGFYFQSVWQSKVTRSDGVGPFVVVHDDPSNNTLYQPRAIAEGFVAP